MGDACSTSTPNTPASTLTPTPQTNQCQHRRALLAPCLLPELSEVAVVSTASPRYYPLTFRVLQLEPGQQEQRVGGAAAGCVCVCVSVRMCVQTRRKGERDKDCLCFFLPSFHPPVHPHHFPPHSSSTAHHPPPPSHGPPRLFHGSKRRIIVQRKPGHLSYNQDPQALRSLLVRPFASGSTGGGGE